MANTITTLSYANTFGDWLVATDSLISENNILAAGDYTKSSGTLYLNETTQNSLQANGNIVVQKQLLVQGTGSSASIQNNLTVGGQVYFSNTTLGLTNAGQANINGLLVAQGSGIGLSVANNAYVGGNSTVRYTTTTNKVQANTSVLTATLQANTSILTDVLQSNTSMLTDALQANNSILTEVIQANTSILTGVVQANNSVNTEILKAVTASVSGRTYTDTLQGNTSINTVDLSVSDTTYTDILRANTSLFAPTANISSSLDANSATVFAGSLQTVGQLSVGGNFVINGSTVYNSNNFTLNAGSGTGQISAFEVNRGSSGANASIRWNESSAYFDVKNVGTSTYYRMLTDDYPGVYATAAYAKANAAAATFVGTTGSFTANTVTFSSNNGVTITSVGSNTFAISTSQDLRTTASPTFNSLTLTTPLALSQGGTGATSAASALTNILPTGTTAGYVLTTGGPGNFYWAAGGTGGSSGAVPGTSINSTRLSYTANGAAGYTGNTYNTPTFTTGTQVRAYINGVRQFESEYSLNQSANTISFTTTPPNGDSILIEVDGYYVNPYYANNITFTAPFSGIVSSANTIQLAIQDIETRKAALAGATFTGDVQGVTMAGGTSNTSFATTAFSANATNLTAGTIPTARLGDSGATAGTFGGGLVIPVITVDGKGRVTSSANTPLASSGVIAGNYGSSTTTPILTIDAYGRVTGATTTLITGGSAGIGATTFTRSTYTATAGQTSFAATYTVGYVQVYLNGVLLRAADYTSSSGTAIVLGAACASGDLVDIFAYTVTLVNNVSPSYTGGQGGAAGQVLYQSAANTTSNTDVGTSGYLLTSGGTGKPTWTAPTGLSLNSSQITTALGFTPYNSTNPTGYITGITSSMVTTALGYTPATNASAQITSLGVGTAASGTTGEIRATNNITAYYSDDNLKTRIGNIEGALDKVMTLNGFYYEANETAQALGYTVKKEVGVSAQEVQAVLPEVVVPAPIDDKYLTVHYERIIPLLIEAIKELKAEVDELKGQTK